MTNVSKVYFGFSRAPPGAASRTATGAACRPGAPGAACPPAAVPRGLPGLPVRPAARARGRSERPVSPGPERPGRRRLPLGGGGTVSTGCSSVSWAGRHGPAVPWTGPPRAAPFGTGASPGRTRRSGRLRRSELRRDRTGGRGRVHGHRQLDAAPQLGRERVRDQRPQPGLQLLLDEFVRGGDQCRVLDQSERPGQLEPRPLVGLDLQIRQAIQRARPYVCEVCFTHRSLPSRAPSLYSTGLSTGCARSTPAPPRYLRVPLTTPAIAASLPGNSSRARTVVHSLGGRPVVCWVNGGLPVCRSGERKASCGRTYLPSGHTGWVRWRARRRRPATASV